MSNAVQFSLSEYDETIRIVLESGGEFRIYPKGTSMLPLLRQGIDSVVLEKTKEAVRRGDIAFYQRDDGSYILHRVIRSDNGTFTMCGDNQLELEKGIEARQLIGVVTRIYRGEKCVHLDSLRYRMYVFWWRSFFIRRVYFRIRRIANGSKKQ